MLIEEDARKYIRKNAIASIGTDGLMGNKLVNIENGTGKAALIEDGDIIQTASSTEIDALISNLSTTSGDLSDVMKQLKKIISDSAMNRIPVAIEDISATALNLKKISGKLDGSDALWNTLSNQQLADNLTAAVSDIRKTGQQASILVTDLSQVVKSIEAGEGTVGMLLSDSISAQKIKMAISNIQRLSDTLIYVSGDLKQITRKINNSDGAVGTILTDTLFAGQLKETMTHLKNSSISLEQNLEALKSNFLFRRYFKKKEKEAKD
jgi:phospholipid/cholesterol/gamma-HCH transport system substrate-binding protein